MTDLTVMFSTCNGESVLPRTLAGYALQMGVGFSWKMIVINNGSTDGTRDILESFNDKLPMEIYEEPLPGKNRALNRGLEYIEGDAIILTDDDAIPDADFLSSWNNSVKKNEKYNLFGGFVEPVFDVKPPSWFIRRRPQFGPLYAENHLTEGPIEARQIFGPNMAVRRTVFEGGLRFHEYIGPNITDTNYSMGSETEFCVRAAKHGHKAWFAHRPRVSHIVRADQITADFWIRRAYKHGRGVAQIHYDSGLLLRESERSKLRQIASHAKFHYWQLLRKIGGMSPMALHRFNNLWEYHWHRGFREEYAKKRRTDFLC